MDLFPTNKAFKAPRIGSLAIISGLLACTVGAVGPAFTADLSYDDAPYRLAYYPNSYSRGDGNSFRIGCYRCSCCGLRITPAAQRFPVEKREPVVVERPVVERFAVAERHWVERDYIKRLNFYYETRYPYPSPYPPYPGRYRYSRYYPGWSADPDRAYAAAPPAEPHRLGYAGAEYPPAAAYYEYAAEPRTPHRYVSSLPYVSSRPYEYRPEYEYRPTDE
jgi:hypothetical protein